MICSDILVDHEESDLQERGPVVNILLLFVLLVVNSLISTWNAFVSGAYLTETRLIGGWPRVLVWCGLVMAACGFTWTYFAIITMIAISTGWLTIEQGQILFNLGYLAIILPVLGSGLGIWAHSVVRAYRTRRFGDVAVATWNTIAQVHNTWEAASEAPNALKAVIEFFTESDDAEEVKVKGLIAIVLLAILCLFLGVLTTALIARWADKRVAIDVVNQRAEFA